MTDSAYHADPADAGRATSLLRRALVFDAAACGGVAAILLVLAGWLGPRLGLDAGLLRVAGLILVPWTAFIVLILSHGNLPRTTIVVAGNLLWAAASVALLVAGQQPLTGLGTAFVLAQTAVVLALTWVQVIGLTRLR